jgi:alpha-amylase/alpha-mannosidase (GH57 family)
MERFICIHGHFYQPPRENPWLEAIEQQDAAEPYHDWNERIAAECYEPNAASRILDARDRIVRIVNNYAQISFDFGPTLLAWMQVHAPETYASVLEGDRTSIKRFGGHGSAMAQPYNHMIMPLSNQRDRRTQVRWGLADFRMRFGREPEGMWLPETAVDLATLDLLAEHGMRFTVLAPNQADATRRIGGQEWTDVNGGRIDPTRPYVQRLPSGREITVFFYDGPASRAVAFEGLLKNGERFAHRLLGLFHEGGSATQLAHIATDGETYGHHHRHGDMALSYALHYIGSKGHARLTNYGEYLELVPPAHEVRIIENTSWSCAHGIERWRSNCGCATGGEPGWSQEWREPLREALDWLRDRLAPRYEEAAAAFLREPWAARDAYIDVILDRSPASLARFVDAHATGTMQTADLTTALRLLEMQRHAMLMYTSCGWFFNDIAGIETVQLLQYAGRAIQLAEELFDEPLEDGFLERIEPAVSNVTAAGDGRRIYDERVRPTKVDLLNVAAHYAVSSLFGGEAQRGRVYCYFVDLEHHATRRAHEATLAVGRARVTSEITRDTETVTFAVLHFGNQHLSGGIRRFRNEVEYRALADGLTRAFAHADMPTVVALLARFPEYTFSLKSLFVDRQREILNWLIENNLRQAEETYRRVYDENAELMRFLTDTGMPLPEAFRFAGEYVIAQELRRTLAADPLDLERARSLLEQADAIDADLQSRGLAFVVQRTLERLTRKSREQPDDIGGLAQLAEFSSLVRTLRFDIDRWRVQNDFYGMVKEVYPLRLERTRNGDEDARRWVELFTGIGEQLAVAVQ